MLHLKKPAFTDVKCAHLATEVGQCSAKLAKAWTKKFYLVGISWVTSPMVWAHRQSNINCGICASAKQHHPTAGSNNQGLHTTCAHQLGDIAHGVHVSARINRTIVTSGISCPYLFWHAHRSVDVESGLSPSPLAFTKQKTNVWCCVSASHVAYKQWSNYSKCSLLVLPFPWTHLSGDFGHGLHLSSIVFKRSSTDIGYGLLASL